jgi:prepilin-type N-terminal cleavage/methylation domain-containing protein
MKPAPFSSLSIRARAKRGFLLIEVMIAVAIFALAVLALGKCVENMVSAQILKDEDEKVRRFLDSKMAEIEAGAIPLSDSSKEPVKDFLPDAKLKITRKQLQRKNEKEQDLFGLYVVNLELTWTSDNTEQSRALTFYIYPRQR